MRWIVQRTLFKEQCERDLVRILRDRGIPHDLVSVVPFDAEAPLRPEPDATGPVMVYGTTTLLKLAIRRGWGPGVFYDPALDWRAWYDHWGDLLLNWDAVVLRFGDLRELPGPRFIRPLADLKVFAGHVVTPEHYCAWHARVLQYPDQVTADTEILMAPARAINAEWRLLVVDGRVVTGSLYSVHGELVQGNIEVLQDFGYRGVWHTNRQVVEFAETAIARWNPLPAYTLDIAEAYPQGLKILETNCINGAGWYAADVGALVDALEAWGAGRGACCACGAGGWCEQHDGWDATG